MSDVETVQASLLVDFVTAANGWNVIIFGIGPGVELPLLLTDVARPYQIAPAYWVSMISGQSPLARYRIVQFGSGDGGEITPAATLELPPTEDYIWSGERLRDGRWLVVQSSYNDPYSDTWSEDSPTRSADLVTPPEILDKIVVRMPPVRRGVRGP